MDGSPVNTKEEQDRLQEVLENTIDKPDLEGVELEVCVDGQLLLSPEIVSVFKDKACWIKRAQISTEDRTSKHPYLITDIYGKAVDQRTLDLIQQQIGENMLRVKKNLGCSPLLLQQKASGFLFGNLIRRLTSHIHKFFKSKHLQ